MFNQTIFTCNHLKTCARNAILQAGRGTSSIRQPPKQEACLYSLLERHKREIKEKGIKQNWHLPYEDEVKKALRQFVRNNSFESFERTSTTKKLISASI